LNAAESAGVAGRDVVSELRQPLGIVRPRHLTGDRAGHHQIATAVEIDGDAALCNTAAGKAKFADVGEAVLDGMLHAHDWRRRLRWAKAQVRKDLRKLIVDELSGAVARGKRRNADHDCQGRIVGSDKDDGVSSVLGDLPALRHRIVEAGALLMNDRRSVALHRVILHRLILARRTDLKADATEKVSHGCALIAMCAALVGCRQQHPPRAEAIWG
jgi:hypothetical protein